MRFQNILILSVIIWFILFLCGKTENTILPHSVPSGYSGSAKVDPYTHATGERITQPSTKVSELYPEQYNKSSQAHLSADPAYIEVLDWANDEYWEIQELNGKYYRVLKDGGGEELGVDEEYEYEEEIGNIEDLYQYAKDNKSRVVKAIRKDR